MTDLGRGWKLRGVLALLALGLVRPAPVHAAGGMVVVVRTSDLLPYKQVESAFNDSLGQPSTTLNATGDLKESIKSASANASLLFAVGPDAAKAVVELRPPVPVIYALVPNPARAGIDAKTPGVPMFVPPKGQLRFIRQVLPGAKKLGVLFDPKLSGPLADEYTSSAAGVGITVVKVAVGSKQEVGPAARELFGKVDALWILPDTTVVGPESLKFLVQTSVETKKPLIGFSEGICKVGALMSVEASYQEIGQKSAVLAKSVLAGSAAPVSPDGAMSLNMKTAELLGLTVPGSARSMAAKVFE